MADTSYQLAHKLALKEARARTARHEDPCLPALEQLLPHLNSLNETDLGVLTIDLDQVAGTRTAARRDAFSASFYPLLDPGSEFAAKWSALAAAHLREGIQEPILAVEYLNRFYVVEGHKRVSVLRFYGAGTVEARVSRLIPERSDAPEVRVYYEFLDFYRVTRVNYILFDQLGSYPALLELLGGEDGKVWDDERRRDFFADVTRFRRALRETEVGGELSRDEALLRYLQILGYEHLQQRSPAELKADLAAIAPELREEGADPVLMTSPELQPRSVISRIIRPPQRSLKAAFLHDKNPDSSFWTYGHEQGRLAVEEMLGDRVDTLSCFDMLQEDVGKRIKDLVEEGFDMLFTTTPKLLPAALAAAADYPGLKVLNCSLNVSHPILRVYYARMYEAKFLTGVIAGSLSVNGSIGYVCNYPVYSAPASINAFALGARMVNPRSRVVLRWSTVPDSRIAESFSENRVTAVSGQDSFVPASQRQELGLFLTQDGQPQNVAYSRWNWGSTYKKIIGSVLDGSWDTLSGAAEAGQTINYWWGLASGAVDVVLGDALPAQTLSLVRFLRQSIIDGSLHPFDGPVYDQAGALRIADGEVLSPEQILRMNWLVDSVEGSIPRIEELTPEAQELVRIQGVMRE